jgi:uncharacterized repeat protein (TIGR01451 family)
MDARAHRCRSDPHAAVAVGLVLLLLGARVATGQAPEASAVGAAVATGSGPLQTEIVAEKYLVPAGPEPGTPRFVPAQRLVAGDEVHYTIRVHNPGKAPVTGIQVTKSMPGGLQFVPESAVGPACDVEYSMNGGTSFQAEADPLQLSHLRWNLRRPLAPGATALIRFRATFR